MKPLDVFTVRDLRQRSGDLLHVALQAKLALISKHGRTAILAILMPKPLLSYDPPRQTLNLLDAVRVTLAQGARLAGHQRIANLV